MEKLVVKKEIVIHAPITKVWEVLIAPQYIRQWDELPESFGKSYLHLGSEIIWQQDNGEYTKLTVIGFESPNFLSMSLFSSLWKLDLKPEDIAYQYTLTPLDGQVLLSIAIGDFSHLLNGINYYEASVEFANSALQKIKELSEE